LKLFFGEAIIPNMIIVRSFKIKFNGKISMSECNCNHGECEGDKSTHKHENGECIHPDGTRHPIHEKH
jgi:hypothetical protein